MLRICQSTIFQLYIIEVNSNKYCYYIWYLRWMIIMMNEEQLGLSYAIGGKLAEAVESVQVAIAMAEALNISETKRCELFGLAARLEEMQHGIRYEVSKRNQD